MIIWWHQKLKFIYSHITHRVSTNEGCALQHRKGESPGLEDGIQPMPSINESWHILQACCLLVRLASCFFAKEQRVWLASPLVNNNGCFCCWEIHLGNINVTHYIVTIESNSSLCNVWMPSVLESCSLLWLIEGVLIRSPPTHLLVNCLRVGNRCGKRKWANIWLQDTTAHTICNLKPGDT